MPRLARVVVPEAAHHVTQRGNRRMDVFFNQDDRRVYLQSLRHFGQKDGCALRPERPAHGHAHGPTLGQRAFHQAHGGAPSPLASSTPRPQAQTQAPEWRTGREISRASRMALT